MQQLPGGGGELRNTVLEPPYWETFPWFQTRAALSSFPHGAWQSECLLNIGPLSRGWRRGCQGLGLSPRPPSGRQLELDWEGGKRELSVLGAEDASKGIRGHFHFPGAAQLCPSEEKAGERVAGSCGSRPFAPPACTHHNPLF